MIEITLPWPPSGLNPNARLHFHDKRRLAKVYRDSAYWLTEKSGAQAPAEGWVQLRIDFHPPDRRRRDLDNMLSSIKSGLDGLADCLKVDDQRFAIWLHRQEPVKNGRVVVSIGG